MAAGSRRGGAWRGTGQEICRLPKNSINRSGKERRASFSRFPAAKDAPVCNDCAHAALHISERSKGLENHHRARAAFCHADCTGRLENHHRTRTAFSHADRASRLENDYGACAALYHPNRSARIQDGCAAGDRMGFTDGLGAAQEMDSRPGVDGGEGQKDGGRAGDALCHQDGAELCDPHGAGGLDFCHENRAEPGDEDRAGRLGVRHQNRAKLRDPNGAKRMGWDGIKQIEQTIDDLWHKRSVRISLVAAVVALTMPTLFVSVNLATYGTFQVPATTWFGVGGEQKGVKTALENKSAILDVVNNYNTAIASGITFVCEYNQRGEPRKECTRTVDMHPSLVEAAIAVQSQWKIPWLDSSLMRWVQGKEHSSEGIAQVSQPELEQWAGNLYKYLPPGARLSPHDPYASAGAVIERLAPVLEYCRQQNCDVNDQVIVAAMAQNGKGFTTETLQSIYNDPEKYLNKDGSINWEEYFTNQKPRSLEGNAATLVSRLVQNLRAVPSNFERQFILQLYINDLILLQARGETLPDGINLEYLACLADRLPGASYHCESGEKE